jgi:hypothetical protein
LADDEHGVVVRQLSNRWHCVGQAEVKSELVRMFAGRCSGTIAACRRNLLHTFPMGCWIVSSASVSTRSSSSWTTSNCALTANGGHAGPQLRCVARRGDAGGSRLMAQAWRRSSGMLPPRHRRGRRQRARSALLGASPTSGRTVAGDSGAAVGWRRDAVLRLAEVVTCKAWLGQTGGWRLRSRPAPGTH